MAAVIVIWVVQRPSLALSEGPNRVGACPFMTAETYLVSETLCSLVFVVVFFLGGWEYQMMNKIPKPSNSECYTQ
jgi:hypothetical protein